MVGIKPTFAPLPLCFWCEEEVEIFASFQELCEMRHGLLTGVCLNIKQSCGGLQMASRLHSRQGLQWGWSGGGEPIFAPRWSSRGIDVQTSRLMIIMAFTTGTDICKQSVHSGTAWHCVRKWLGQCWVTNKDCNFVFDVCFCVFGNIYVNFEPKQLSL